MIIGEHRRDARLVIAEIRESTVAQGRASMAAWKLKVAE